MSKRLRSEFVPKVPVGSTLCKGDIVTLRNIFEVNTSAACTPNAEFTGLITTVWLHEQRHADTTKAAALEPANDVHTLWEPLVAGSETVLLELVRDKYENANIALFSRSESLDLDPAKYSSLVFHFWNFVFAWDWFEAFVKL